MEGHSADAIRILIQVLNLRMQEREYSPDHPSATVVALRLALACTLVSSKSPHCEEVAQLLEAVGTTSDPRSNATRELLHAKSFLLHGDYEAAWNALSSAREVCPSAVCLDLPAAACIGLVWPKNL